MGLAASFQCRFAPGNGAVHPASRPVAHNHQCQSLDASDVDIERPRRFTETHIGLLRQNLVVTGNDI